MKTTLFLMLRGDDADWENMHWLMSLRKVHPRIYDRHYVMATIGLGDDL